LINIESKLIQAMEINLALEPTPILPIVIKPHRVFILHFFWIISKNIKVLNNARNIKISSGARFITK